MLASPEVTFAILISGDLFLGLRGLLLEHFWANHAQVHQSGIWYPVVPPLGYRPISYFAKRCHSAGAADLVNDCVCVHMANTLAAYRHEVKPPKALSL